MKINICPECGTALGMEEGIISVTYTSSDEKRIYKDCNYCEGRGYLEEIVGYDTGGEQRMSYTCTACGGSGYEETDMVII